MKPVILERGDVLVEANGQDELSVDPVDAPESPAHQDADGKGQ